MHPYLPLPKRLDARSLGESPIPPSKCYIFLRKALFSEITGGEKYGVPQKVASVQNCQKKKASPVLAFHVLALFPQGMTP